MKTPMQSATLGAWDRPQDDAPVTVDDGRLQLAGWALGTNTTFPPVVAIFVDGVLHTRVLPSGSRPDLESLRTGYPAGGCWDAAVDVGTRRWVHVEVVIDDAGRRQSVGHRYFDLTPSAGRDIPPLGCLDLPRDGDAVTGQLIHVIGWVYFAGSDVDVVDVYVDEAIAARARRCDARRSVGAAIGATSRNALASGFSALLPLPHDADAATERTVEIYARAQATGGRVWKSSVARVTITLRQPRELNVPQLDPLPWALPESSRKAPTRPGRPSIGVFTHSLALGGGELYLQELLLRLAADDFADILVISPSDGPLRIALEAAGIDVHITSPYTVDLQHYGGRATELVSLVAMRRCTVVLANTIAVFPAVDAVLNAGIPVVWAIHESFHLAAWDFLNWGPNGLDPAVEHRRLQALRRSRTIFEAEATHSLFRDEVPGLNGRCIRYGIDLDAIAHYQHEHPREELRARLGFAKDSRVILCMGVIQERKAQLALVCAFAQLVEANPNVTLVLVGDHPTDYSMAVHQVIESERLGDAIRVLPIQPDTYKWYTVADVMVSASDVESLPRSLLEAMAFGVPTLATDVFGLSEVITDGVNGWLCRSRSGVALLAGLRRVLATSPEDLETMRRQCRTHALAFDGRDYADAYKTLLLELAEQTGTQDA